MAPFTYDGPQWTYLVLMNQRYAHMPAKEAAQSAAVEWRSKVASDFRRKEWLWETVQFAATMILAGEIVLVLLILIGILNIQLTLERDCCGIVLLALTGGLLYLCRDQLFRLRNASSANLTSLSEAEALERIQLMASNQIDVEILKMVTQAAVALTRGTSMKAGTTNQTLELAKREVQLAPKPRETAFGPAMLQQLADMINQSNELETDSGDYPDAEGKRMDEKVRKSASKARGASHS